MDVGALRREAGAIQWFHTIDLGHGVITAGVDDTPRKLHGLCLPRSLAGKTVLDVGAWDGFFSFEAERRGAARVLAVDSYCWSGPGWGSKAGFELARRVLQSHVEDMEMDVEAISPDTVGAFDVVLFLGVLYHMRHPLAALERIAAVTRELLVLETEVDLISLRTPALAFYPGTELNRDPTNWWAPNPRALTGLLKEAGFASVETVHPPRSFPARLARSVLQFLRERKSISREWRRDRMVVHARK
jgi:tRNA (mo5U34)-methyltransferase